MDCLVISRQVINENMELCTKIAGALLLDKELTRDSSQLLSIYSFNELGVGYIICKNKPTESPLLYIQVHGLKKFTNNNEPFQDHILPTFIESALQAAADIWSGRREPAIDFDNSGLFYRRPKLRYGTPHPQWEHETYVFVTDPEKKVRVSVADLVLFAVGQTKFNLPDYDKIECDFPLYRSWENRIKKELYSAVSPNHNAPPIPAMITSLDQVQGPTSLSYDAWLVRVSGSAQGKFITSGLARPQRVEGPAGSGKTLSLVLKCLYTLKHAAKLGARHHAAFVVFGTDTESRIRDEFFSVLDEDGFHLRSREEQQQTVTVTTLLKWSEESLRGIADPYELSHNNPAKAKQDQVEMIVDLVNNRLPTLLPTYAKSLSSSLRADLSVDKGLLSLLFQHEFGVIIKGLAERDLEKYLILDRPAASLAVRTEADRRFLYMLFESYQEHLAEYGIVDLDDIAISHAKLLEMPLRRRRREAYGFDSVFIDEAHCFNPNELSVLQMLLRESADRRAIVVAVDIPQGIGSKGYEGDGLEKSLFQASQSLIAAGDSYYLDTSHRCSREVLELANSIYAQGARFFAPVRTPSILKSARISDEQTVKRPTYSVYADTVTMLNAILANAEMLSAQCKCRHSDILIVFFQEQHFEQLPPQLLAASVILQSDSDMQNTRIAQRNNSYVLARPEFLHGLEYEAVLLVGITAGEVPKMSLTRGHRGAAAIYATQRSVDLLYLALTRARQTVSILAEKKISALFELAITQSCIQPIKPTE